jgi:hypothetical protein
MSTKIEAPNEIVINYLKNLWYKEPNLEIKEEEKEIIEEKIEMKEEPQENPDVVQFKEKVKSNLQALRDVGFRVYHNITLEKEVNLQPKTVTDDDILKVHEYKVGNYFTRKQLMTNIAKCTVFPKYKSGLVSEPSNFRYLVNHHNTIKILDRLWVLETMEKIGENIPDPDIYKSNLVKNFSDNIINTAIANTLSLDSIILLDIKRAFDSLEWEILEELLLANITRKTNADTAKDLVSQYMVILKNRELYYNNILINISKGIPTGLPSSNLVFTLAFEEIIFRWMNTYGYKNNREFMLNIYVDDIFIKMINLLKTKEVVCSLIDYLAIYKLFVNMEKSKASDNLLIYNNFDTMYFGITTELKETDYYLGIPFTRNKKLYGELILKEFQTKKFNMNWNTIYNKLSSDNDETTSIIFGFMNYKLKPIMNNNGMSNNKEIVSKFINDTYIKKGIVGYIGDFFRSIGSFFKV